jgi:hypothetical protein
MSSCLSFQHHHGFLPTTLSLPLRVRCTFLLVNNVPSLLTHRDLLLNSVVSTSQEYRTFQLHSHAQFFSPSFGPAELETRLGISDDH